MCRGATPPYQCFPGKDGLTVIGHGGDPSGSGTVFPGEETEGFHMQTDSLGPRLPARELVDHRTPGPAAIPGIWPGHGGSRDSHGYSASMEESAVCAWQITLIKYSSLPHWLLLGPLRDSSDELQEG